MARLLASSPLLALAAASIVTISVDVPEQGAILAGMSIRITYTAVLTAGDAANLTHARLVPFLDGAQYGAEVGFTGVDGNGQPLGEAYIPLPWSTATSHALVLAYVGDPVDGATMGNAPPTGALLSNAVDFDVAPRVPQRPHVLSPGDTQLNVYWEAWFTPVNYNWQSWYGGPHGAGMAEAIPAIGRYYSFDLECLRTQAAQFTQAGVDAIVVDWTNNCWLPVCDSWANRSMDTQQIVNSTDLAFGVYAGLRATEGWDVPRFIILLALNNGGNTAVPALLEELEYIAQHYLANATAGGVDSFVILDGKPLVLVFDARGLDHSNVTHANFTLRWMASQLQATPDYAARGYWSWMDATLDPVLTIANDSVVEAAVIEPAFFAGGGWLNTSSAVGRSGGLTLLAELSGLVSSTAGRGGALPSFVNVCQWNEYSGTPEGRPPAPDYEDCYSPDLSNDLEPTSPWAPAYQRPGNVRAGGGYGYLGLNALAMARAALVSPAVVDNSTVVFVVSPAVGDLSNYTTSRTIVVTFVVARFSLVAMRDGLPFLANVSLPVQVAVDGATVASLAAPAVPGLQTFELDTTALDARFPHVLSIMTLPPVGGGDEHLTRWPLSFDAVDADVPGGVPLATPVAARGTAWVWLPESQV